MKHLHYYLFVSFVIVGCDLTGEKGKETIDEPHEIITIKDDDGVHIQLSEVFDTIKFIPLRNNKNGAVTVDKIIFDKDRIYILREATFFIMTT